MPNGYANGSAFNRSVSGVLGSGLFQKTLSIGITTPKRKYLNSIHISANNASSPADLQDFLIRVAVSSSGGNLLNNPSILDFNPLNAIGSGTENSNLGTIYYDQVITLPYNNPIIFDTPILFTEGEPIYVIVSIAYADGDSQLTPPARNVWLSVNGYYEESDNVRYAMRA